MACLHRTQCTPSLAHTSIFIQLRVRRERDDDRKSGCTDEVWFVCGFDGSAKMKLKHIHTRNAPPTHTRTRYYYYYYLFIDKWFDI